MSSQTLTSWEAYLNSAMLLHTTGEDKQALALAEKAKRLAPNRSDVLIVVGVIQDALGKNVPAEKTLRKALRLAPTNLEAQKTLGLYLVRQGRPSEGLELLTEYIRQGNWKDHDVLAIILQHTGWSDLHSSVCDLLFTAWVNSANPDIGRMFAEAAFRTNRLDRAASAFQTLAETANSPHLFNQLGQVYLKDSEYDQAIQAFSQAVTLAHQAWESGEMLRHNIADEDLAYFSGNLALAYLEIGEAYLAYQAATRYLEGKDKGRLRSAASLLEGTGPTLLVSRFTRTAPYTWKCLLKVLLAQGAYSEAAAQWEFSRPMIEKGDAEELAEIDTLYLEALAKLDPPDPQRYKKAFGDLAKSDPDQKHHHLDAVAYFTAHQLYKDAWNVYQQFTSGDPESPEFGKTKDSAWEFLLLNFLEHHEKARQVLETSLEKPGEYETIAEGFTILVDEKSFIHSYFIRAVYSLWRKYTPKDHSILEAMLSMMVEVRPKAPDFRLAYGLALLNNQHPEAAEVQFRTGLELADDDHKPWLQVVLSSALLVQGKIETAEIFLNEVSGIEFIGQSEYIPQMAVYRCVIWANGKFELGAGLTDIGFTPASVPVMANRAAIAAQAGRWDEATSLALKVRDFTLDEEYENLQEASSSLAQRLGNLLLGGIYSSRGDKVMARYFWNLAWEFVPSESPAEKTLEAWLADLDTPPSP